MADKYSKSDIERFVRHGYALTGRTRYRSGELLRNGKGFFNLTHRYGCQIITVAYKHTEVDIDASDWFYLYNRSPIRVPDTNIHDTEHAHSGNGHYIWPRLYARPRGSFMVGGTSAAWFIGLLL